MCTFFRKLFVPPTVRAVAGSRRIPKRTPEQKAEVGAFVERLYGLSGASNNVEFASRAGLYGSNVGEYRSGATMPDAYTLIKLMASIDVELRAKGEVVDLGVSSAPHVRPAELQGAVAELLEWQAKAIEQLSELDTRLAQLEIAPASRRTNRQKTAG